MEGAPVLRGGIFTITDTAMQHPMSWRAGMEMLNGLMLGGFSENQLKKFGWALRDELHNILMSGNAVTKDLSPLTVSHKGDSRPFVEKGSTLADHLEPQILGEKKAVRGYSGIALIPNKGATSHSGKTAMLNYQLFSVLCQEGLSLSAEQLGPKKVAAIMAWRDANFGNTGPDAKGIWEKKAKRLSWGHKPFLFIPPRPLFTDPVKIKLAEYVRRNFQKYFHEGAVITAHRLGYEHWDVAGIAKTEADLASLDIAHD